MKVSVTNSDKKEILIPVGDIHLPGELFVPKEAIGLVIFSHGSGSSRFSPRNNMVAEHLHSQGFGTLLFDLLTHKEDAIYSNRFDIDLLTKRLTAATGWVLEQDNHERLHVGYFGASTGAASALNAAANLSNFVKAVVSRGGRPDLSMSVLHQVKAPVLLMVGGLDRPVIELNQQAYEALTCQKELKIIPDATHLFDETGKLEEVAKLAADWFKKHLRH